ncbi:MAG: hypothetical protein KF696_11805 [Planctomycetes bacterium]|nr:hypothetical protein [Planctomycetota bacterium]MCW8136973.1 hypothetical protein [Planctomycetota bacterium]
MSAYTPADWFALLPVAGMLAALLLIGFFARGGRLRALCWLMGPPAIAGTHWLLLTEPAGVRMVALCLVLFFWMKAVVTASQAKPDPGLASGAVRKGAPGAVGWLAWALLWPGMRSAPGKDRAGASGTGLMGCLCIVAGVASIAAGHFVWRVTGNGWLASPLLLAGISLCLHYGLFGVIAWGWRRKPLFRNPFASANLRDFWGKRWNIAYTEMMQEAVQRPLRRRPRLATFAIFVFSGLLHEVAVSLPVMAGFGLPTLYFALHGAAMTLENRVVTPGTWPARVWTALWVIVPLPLVFHPWFLRGVVWPIGGMT